MSTSQAARKAGYQVRIDSGEPLAGLLDGRTPLVWTSARVVYDSPDKSGSNAASNTDG